MPATHRDQGYRVPLKLYAQVYLFSLPLFFAFLTDLNEEGLFRMSGSQTRMAEIKEAWNNGKMTSFNEKNPHDVASAFKHYFRELPEPLFISETFARFEELISEENMEKKIRELKELVALQPPMHFRTARAVFAFLKEITKHSATNKMSSSNMFFIVYTYLFNTISFFLSSTVLLFLEVMS